MKVFTNDIWSVDEPEPGFCKTTDKLNIMLLAARVEKIALAYKKLADVSKYDKKEVVEMLLEIGSELATAADSILQASFKCDGVTSGMYYELKLNERRDIQ